MAACERPIGRARSLRIGIAVLLSSMGALPARLTQGALAPAAFVVAGSQFHSRNQDDAGEVRICLQNTSRATLSMAQLRVQVATQEPDGPGTAGTGQKYVYARLWPPVLQPGQHGQLVAKLFNRPANGSTLACTVSAAESAVSCSVPLTEPVLWISYVGFSPDLRRVFVYVENSTDEVVRTESLEVGGTRVEDRAGAINRLVPPNDKGCLIGRLCTALTPGEVTHVAVSARKGDQDVHVHSINRAINRFPLMMVESGTPDPNLRLDPDGFTETMTCIDHNHGTPEQAAGKFLEDYVRRFHQDPHQVIQLDICRSNSPPAWFRFGSLPDVARMNPILSPPPNYDKQERRQWFNPFFYRSHLAKKAVEPCRYVAVAPLNPEQNLFLRKELTPQEIRFLVYCAVAGGAKGLCYRGVLTDDPLSRSAFMRLNRELRRIEPLLLIGDAVDWVTATDSTCAAKTLLCGDQAILAVVFDRRYFSQRKDNKFYTPPFGKAVTPVRVDIKIPREVSVKQVRSMFGPLDPGSWICREGSLSFTAEMIDSAQVYLVDLQHQVTSSQVGE